METNLLIRKVVRRLVVKTVVKNIPVLNPTSSRTSFSLNPYEPTKPFRMNPAGQESENQTSS